MRISTHRIISVALALFAMLFGSGNIVFPLALGRAFGTQALYAIAGFFLTAVFVPLLGVIVMALYEGDYRAFLMRIGYLPGLLLMTLCFALIGPFCIIPRCIAISYDALVWVFPGLTLFVFSLLAALLIAACTLREGGVTELLGKFLGPLKLVLLSVVIVVGFFIPAQTTVCMLPTLDVFKRGLLDGFGTLDLFATIFFSTLVISMLKRDEQGKPHTQKEVLVGAIKVGALGAFLLGVVYLGFVLVSAWQSSACLHAAPGQLLSSLASVLLGAHGGVLASLTLAVACLTTAIALTTIFATYLSHELLAKRITYAQSVLLTLAISVVFANLGFAGIMRAIEPLLMVTYPALIALTITAIVGRTTRIDLGAIPFYAVLIISIASRFV